MRALTGGLLMVLLGVGPMTPPPVCKGRSAQGYDPARDESPSLRALAEVQVAYDALCPKHDCGRGALYANPTAGMNAYTFVTRIDGGKGFYAKIVYSRAFLDSLNQRFGPGASFGVLAHEVGHHLTAAKAMRKRMESGWNEELRADFFAGCALGRSGQDVTALENALRALASTASETHPSFETRVPVVRQGFDECALQAEEVARLQPPFGLASLVERPRKGCWRYPFRLEAERQRLGPLGPRLRFSAGFSSRAKCEVARRARQDHFSRACACPNPTG